MTPPLPRDEPLTDDPRALLSALADGDRGALPGACAQWRSDADARATWHTYHLIGDVLRSDDLAQPAAHDAAFLARLRERLADEPALLAPTPAAVTPARRRQPWVVPAAAAAAGFMAVAGVLVATRVSAPDGAAPVLTAASAPVRTVAALPSPAPVRVIRDAQLDSYLQAHLEARGGGAAAVPGGVPRNVETLTISAPLAAPAGTR